MPFFLGPFGSRSIQWLSNGLYWLLWIIVAILLTLAPNEGWIQPNPGPSQQKQAPAQATPNKPESKPKYQTQTLDWKLTPALKTEKANPNQTTSAKTYPSANIASRLPLVKVTSKPGTYPDSNERGQIRLDATLSASSSIPIAIDPSGLGQAIAFRLMGPVQGLLIQAENEPAVGDLKGLVAQLTHNAGNDREKAERLFDFVVNNIKDWYYPAQGIDLTVEDLSVLIWNFGFGFCYDLGRLQAGLWAEAGLRSRIVGWPQHTVAEVFYDNAWHLYDQQHRSFYEAQDGNVASFADLKADPNLFYQNLNAYGLDAIGYPPHHMAHWYSIANPKFEDSEDGPHWRVEKDFRINLRKGELFDILYTQPGPIYRPDSWHQYYGEMTLRKDPPWPVHGRLTYAPDYMNLPAQWQKVNTPSGKPGFAITMRNPYIFTEAWLKVPGMQGFSKYWIHVWDQTQFGGRLVGGNALFSKHIAGSNEFTVIVEPEGDGKTLADFGLERAQIHTRFQMAPLGLPKLYPGLNRWPISFEAGTPHVSLWYMERSPELKIGNMMFDPPNPRLGTQVEIKVAIHNQGSAKSQPTSLTLFNNVTAFLSETIEKVGTQTVPPLAPGATTSINFPWIANIRMTWYGQNPYVQLFDVWLDMEGDQPDPKRENNRRQDYVLLAKEDGSLPELPGYQTLPGTH